MAGGGVFWVLAFVMQTNAPLQVVLFLSRRQKAGLRLFAGLKPPYAPRYLCRLAGLNGETDFNLPSIFRNRGHDGPRPTLHAPVFTPFGGF